MVQATDTLELLTTSEMAAADRASVMSPGGPLATYDLMEAAGAAIASEIRRWSAGGGVDRFRRVLVLCGPGNNGGDGFVAGRLLAAEGREVRLVLLGDRVALKGDAAEAARRWLGAVESWTPSCVDGADLVVDALFGAGLTRQLDGTAAEIVAAVNRSGKPVLAVDVPSGLDGTTGAVNGPVIEAGRTVTFFRRKPGHLLYPGRRLCGEVAVADIGIPATVLASIGPRTFANAPALWHDVFPQLSEEGHKYGRGHLLVASGGQEMAGAARLSARAGLRIGAGLVTLAAPDEVVAGRGGGPDALLLKRGQTADELARILSDRRKNAAVIGPGLGLDEAAPRVAAVLESGASAVLDADAITAMAAERERFLGKIADEADRAVVLTPHEGEFARLFPDAAGSKLDRARSAAAESKAVVLLKGPDTVIAAPDGRAAINENAPPWLATAGAGDVLAGLIGGLLAQRMPAWEAACAAAWLHGACASRFGRGLIADDLVDIVPGVLGEVIHPRPWP